jgi:anaerobic ribonucleoside-triphosphate reductase activating protein
MDVIYDQLQRKEISGITLSGGDPLYQAKDLVHFLKQIRFEFPDKDIWLYTGYDYEDVCDLDILKYVNVLVDGKFILSQRDITLPFRGSLNQRIIKLKNGEYDGNYDFS